MLQQFKTNICERMDGVKYITELRSSCFRSHHSFSLITNGASANHSTSINTAKTFMDISNSLSAMRLFEININD